MYTRPLLAGRVRKCRNLNLKAPRAAAQACAERPSRSTSTRPWVTAMSRCDTAVPVLLPEPVSQIGCRGLHPISHGAVHVTGLESAPVGSGYTYEYTVPEARLPKHHECLCYVVQSASIAPLLFVFAPVLMLASGPGTDNLVQGSRLPGDRSRPILVRIEADFVTCTQ